MARAAQEPVCPWRAHEEVVAAAAEEPDFRWVLEQIGQGQVGPTTQAGVDGRDAGQRAGGLVAALLCGDGSQHAGHRGQVGQIHVAVGIGIQRAGGVLPSSTATGTGAGAQAIERFIKILVGEEVIAGDVEAPADIRQAPAVSPVLSATSAAFHSYHPDIT